MSVQKQVRTFRRKYRIRTVNSTSLRAALRRQGYTVVEFNGISEAPDTAALIAALQLEEEAARSKCFTYRNDKYRLVFLNEDLNEEERTVVLAHEEGHILNRHMTQAEVIGENVVQEYEANEFAHYLLRDKTGKKRRRAILAAVCALLLAAGVCTGVFFGLRHDRAVYTEDLYRTATGTRYHVRDCVYVKYRNDVVRLTKEEFDSGAYQPCRACLPDRDK